MSTATPIRHFTTAEVADRLRVTKRTLEDMRKAGKGPKAMILGPRMVRYAEADVLAYEQACRQKGGV